MRVWKVISAKLVHGNPTLVLGYNSPDGDQNFPGNLRTTATFTFKPDNTLRIEFNAITDKITLCNLTEHIYFNLGGDSSGDILGDYLTIRASSYLTTDSMLVPDGKTGSLTNSSLNFNGPTPIGAHITDNVDMLNYGHGFDLCYVLEREKPDDLEFAAKLEDFNTGRVLQIFTTQPGVQLYSGNWLNSTSPGIGGAYYKSHDGVALECQHFPDSPNHPNFPSTVLKPGEKYDQVIDYRFSVNMPYAE
jgi:aldose 1-epimerase